MIVLVLLTTSRRRLGSLSTRCARHLRDFENISPTAATILDDVLEGDGPDECLDW